MALMSQALKLKSVDFYRKIPKDMTEGTIPRKRDQRVGQRRSSAMLLVSEISTATSPRSSTRASWSSTAALDGDLMRINFNVSFPALSCEFASVDVGDAMGLNRYNLTKTVFKRPIDADLNPLGPDPVGARPREAGKPDRSTRMSCSTTRRRRHP